MENDYIRLVPADPSLAEQVADYYRRNRNFLESFEPKREESFFTPEHQREILEKEMRGFRDRTAFRFYITPVEQPEKIIGAIGLSQVVWGAFRSAFLGYKLDESCVDRGYMTMAVGMLARYAFDEVGLHRIEANVMPRNTASLRVLEKNAFLNEGISRYYLNINGRWEDHIHMVKINYAMHERGLTDEKPFPG